LSWIRASTFQKALPSSEDSLNLRKTPNESGSLDDRGGFLILVMAMRPVMSPIRTRTFLLLLTFVGIFCYYSDISPILSRSQDFVAVPDPLHHVDAGTITKDSTIYTGEVLLVSAFFPLNHTRHSNQEYGRWIGNFLRTVQTPIYFFTSPEILPLIQEQRGPFPITINSSYANPFDVPPVQGLYDEYYKMHRQNKDHRAEEPGLYALRTAKPWFLTEGVKNYERGLPSGSKSIEYAFWVDIGSFQDGLKVQDWPNVERVREVFREGTEATRKNEDELVFFPMNDVPNLTMQWWKEDMGPFYTIFAQGTSFPVPVHVFCLMMKDGPSLASFFGGTPNAIEWWKEVYLKYHDYWLFKRGAFVGQDRTMFNSLSLLFPERIITVWPSDQYAPNSLEDEVNPLGMCGDMYVLSPLPSPSHTLTVFLRTSINSDPDM